MYKLQIVLELLVLYVGISHSWDIAVSYQDLLEFYTNETQIDQINSKSQHLSALAYDEIHDMLLYVDKQNNDAICGYKISPNTYYCYLETHGRNIHGLAFDPITQFIFFTDKNERSVNWIKLKPKTINFVNLLIKLDEGIPTDIAVDGCRGYVYWISTNLPTPKIERVRFDGSEREVILNLNSLYINSYTKREPHSLIIDQETQRMYWIQPTNSTMYHIYYADLNGNNQKATTGINVRGYVFTNPTSNTMTVSKTNLFLNSWWTDSDTRTKIYKTSKEKHDGHTSIRIDGANQVYSIVAKNKIKIQDLRFCETMKCLERTNSVDRYCVHGEKVFLRCLCKCAPGYIGKRCDVSVCDNYCLQGSCSLNDDGLPKCSCKAGYSGDRCENSEGLYCVHGEKVIGQPACKCAPGYIGERCDISVCDNYCLQGSCSVNDDGLPKCRCNAGYSGERCENSDGLYCVHGEKVIGQSTCKCAPGYIGERCDISVCDNYCLQGHCSVNDDGLPKCRCNVGYSGDRCENSEGLYCVHGEKVIGQSTCKCAPGYIGERCDVSVCDNYCLQGYCSVNDDGFPKCRCNAGYSGDRCENSERLYCVHGEKVIGQSACKCAPGYIGDRCDISVCDNYCLQGHCSVNGDGLPKCRCNAGYSGDRCENSEKLYCVHGEKVIGQSACKCAPGYIGERCDISVCDNYCLQGHCSVNDDGLPKCRCNAGYSGDRCENSERLYCVHGEKVIGQSACKCAPGYIGERCDISVCDNYCLQGYCSVNSDGLPKCRCNSGFSGNRCETVACHGFCLNNGVCSLNEEDEPSCECVGGYQGSRCEVSSTQCDHNI